MLSNSPSRYQVVSYLLVLLMVGSFYGAASQLPRGAGWAATVAVFSAGLLALLVSGAASSCVDPTDPLIEEYNQSRGAVPCPFDEANKAYCDICRSYVESRSKHCLTCKRCASGFDHHCKWINNCIGERNYGWFVGMIVSLPVAVGAYLALCGLFILEATRSPLTAAMVVVWVIAVPLAAFGAMDLSLLCFHMYLRSRNMTTYQWIIERTIDGEQRIVPKEDYDPDRSKSLDLVNNS